MEFRWRDLNSFCPAAYLAFKPSTVDGVVCVRVGLVENYALVF